MTRDWRHDVSGKAGMGRITIGLRGLAAGGVAGV